ncbi:MAG: DEAD/DEAH box helicase family protein [Candidatus Hodarchaeota archaeon]
MVTLVPRDYQINARDQVIAKIDEGIRRLMIFLPTGMGKTLISIISIQYLAENGYIKDNEKVLFLVADRKLKHQLNDMAAKGGLGNFGNLYVLPEADSGIPANLCRQHASMSRFIFATPVLFINSIIARSRATQRLDRTILKEIKVVVIDEVLDVLAQSYGKKRTREETVEYIMKIFNVSDFDLLLEEIGARYNLQPRQVEGILFKEFAPRYFRLNKKFEPVLSLLGLLNPDSDIIIIGLTASFSQEMKRKFLLESLGGLDKVAEIFPEGEDYEDYRPSIVLKKIRVLDDFIVTLDDLIQQIKNSALKNIRQAYYIATDTKSLPPDRIMLFVTDLLSKTELTDRISQKLAKSGLDSATITERIRNFKTSAAAYLLITVSRQRLLEDTFKSFYINVKGVKNGFLLSNDNFKEILSLVSEKMEELKKEGITISEKDKKILYWVKRITGEGKKVLVMCRFINMVDHLHQIITDEGVSAVKVFGKMSGTEQHRQLSDFKTDPSIMVLVASERLIEKGTDLPEVDVGMYYGATISLERYEQSLGRIRSTAVNLKTVYTVSYNLTVEAEKSAKRDAAFLELLERGGKKSILLVKEEDE